MASNIKISIQIDNQNAISDSEAATGKEAPKAVKK